MKKILLIFLFLVSFQLVSAQDSTSVSKEKPFNFSGVDVKPEYPGGASEFYKFIGKNYKIPYVKGLNGKVYVSFVIEMDGSVVDIKVFKDIGYGTGDEAIRVLKLSPKWTPGEQNGKKVRCMYTLPINISK